MEERQVTVDGLTHKMQSPFMVIATQNPIEHEGTYRLPEAQLDRFLMKITVGYPSLDEEVKILDDITSRPLQTCSVPCNRLFHRMHYLSARLQIRQTHIEPSL